MKGLSALCLLLTLGAIVNAAENQWMWDPSRQGGVYWLYDILFAAAFVLLGTFLWRIAHIQAQRQLFGLYGKHARGEITDDDLTLELLIHERDFGVESSAAVVASAERAREERLWAGRASETYMARVSEAINAEDKGKTETVVGSGERASTVSRDLSGANTSDEDLAQLSEMSELVYLDLSKSRVTDAGLVHLATLKKLDLLDLSDTRVAGKGLDALASAPITWLDLTRTAVTDEAMGSLARLQALEMLRLNETAITDDGLAKLAGLDSLVQLDISDTAVTDAGLGRFLSLTPEPPFVYARRTAVTELAVGRWLEEGHLVQIKSEQVEAEIEAEMTQQRADDYFQQTAERFDELFMDEQNSTREGDLNEAIHLMMDALGCKCDPSEPRSRGAWQLGSAGYCWRCAETVVRPHWEDERICEVVKKSLDTDLDRATRLALAASACFDVPLGQGSPGGLIFGPQFLERACIFMAESLTDATAALSEEDAHAAFYFGVALRDVEPFVDQLI
jgi:hypothetical protein